MHIMTGMRRRTTLNLDHDLVHDAAQALGTTKTTQTIHAAMEDVVARARRRRLAERELPDLTPDAIEQMRRARSGAR